jgi:glycosyltransferase involved in cell wall biosynthesis
MKTDSNARSGQVPYNTGGSEQGRSMRPTVILLTYNSSASLPATLSSLAGLTDDIHIVDSGSTDDTIAIARSFDAKVLSHPFENYGRQRNWAIDNVAVRYSWQLHLDADERLTPGLREEILSLPEDSATEGFFVPRYVQFMGRLLRHNLAPTWHMRLFRNGRGRCEEREYDQHFLCRGATAQLRHEMIDDMKMPLTEWTARHNRWSDAEVRELLARRNPHYIQPKLDGNVVERKRALRKFYERTPLFVRPFALFFYRYFSGGFLDGKEGFIFCVLQTFWFRFLIDAKLYEQHQAAAVLSAPEKS